MLISIVLNLNSGVFEVYTLRKLIRKIILESADSVSRDELVNTYEENLPPSTGHATDHKVAISSQGLQDWKVKTKKYFMQHADHNWFNENFTVIAALLELLQI